MADRLIVSFCERSNLASESSNVYQRVMYRRAPETYGADGLRGSRDLMVCTGLFPGYFKTVYTVYKKKLSGVFVPFLIC